MIRAASIEHARNPQYTQFTSLMESQQQHKSYHSNGYYFTRERKRSLPTNDLSLMYTLNPAANTKSLFGIKIHHHGDDNKHPNPIIRTRETILITNNTTSAQNKRLLNDDSTNSMGKKTTLNYVPQIETFFSNINNQNAPNTSIQNESDQQLDGFNVLLISQYARNELAKHIFNELIIKNFTDSLDTSPTRLNAAFKEALSSAVNEPNILMDGSPNALSSNNSSGIISQSQASLNGTLLTAATLGSGSVTGGVVSHLGNHINGGVSPKPYFGDALYSFQSMYWPIHCVICLIICTLGIFANVTNIVVLTR